MTIYTIGHSNVPIDRFLPLLTQHHIDVLVDTRSRPYSRYCPHFNRERLKTSLQEAGIGYLYLGDRLGGRPADARFYRPDGTVEYDCLAQAPFYLEGIELLKKEATEARLAIMCAEVDYRKCHRYWLITRSLVGKGVEVQHILHSGELVHTSPDEFTSATDQLHLF
jgi:uncharacterized protein (DUF488 family)